MEPIEAAQRIAAWQPVDEFGGATRFDAARELEQLIDSDFLRWLGQDQAPILDALRDPAYAERYIVALAKHLDELGGYVPAVLDAVEAAEQKLLAGEQPPRGHDDGSWANVVSAGVDLIAKLAAAGSRFEAETGRGWDLIERAVRRREELPGFDEQNDEQLLQRAISRPSMRALSDAVVYAAATERQREQSRLLVLLDEILELDPPDGLHARAIIARHLPWLAWGAPDWTSSRWNRLVGDDAPDGLGIRTFDQYLEWGAPRESLLTEHRDLYLAALKRVPNHARRHLLHAMLWGLDGYDPASMLDVLSAAGDGQVAEAIRWLSFGAFHQPDMPLDHAIEFLRLALERGLPADAVEALGWLSRVERIESYTWLDITLSAVRAGNGQLDQADDVAERAAKHPDDERAIHIVAGLLDANIKLWHLEDIGRVGLQLVKGSDPSTHAAREELREQLLKREFFDARPLRGQS